MLEQTADKSILPAPDSEVARRRRRWREIKDRAARYGVGFGGVSVIITIVLIFFYLLYVVMPLFSGARIETAASYQTSVTESRFLSMNEYNDVALSVNKDGTASFFNAENGKIMLEVALPVSPNAITS